MTGVQTCALPIYKQAMVVKSKRGRPRRSISSAKQRMSQKVSSIIQSDILGNFVAKDMHCERMGQNGS